MGNVKVLSLFSGAGGLDLGLERAGMEVVALCEIDPKARAVLRRHWPDVRIYHDVKEVSREQLERDGIHAPNLVAGGSPCQDLSVAGKRRGLDGSRSNLFWEQCRIADEYGADIFWENVPGALSSNNGADFAAVLWGITGALVDLPDGKKWAKAGIVVGPKRTAVWRIADAQRFGVPQRRRRIYIVGCSGAVARRLAPLLLESQGSQGHRAAGREAGSRTARTVADGSDDAGSGRAGTVDGFHLNTITANVRNGSVDDGVTQTLLAHKNGWSVNDLPMVLQEPQAFVKVIRSGARDAEGNLPPEVWREEPTGPTLNIFDNNSEARSTVLFVQPAETVSATGDITHALTASSSKGTTEDGTGRGVPVVSQPAFRMLGFGHYVKDEHASALKARDYKDATDLVVQFGQAPTGESDIASPLGAPGTTGGFRFDLETCGAYVVIPNIAKTLTTEQRLDPSTETLIVEAVPSDVDTGGGLPGQGFPAVIQPVGFSHTQGLDPQVSTDVFPTLRAEGGGQAVAYVPFMAFTQNQREEVRDLGDVAAALTAEHGSHLQTYIAQPVADE